MSRSICRSWVMASYMLEYIVHIRQGRETLCLDVTSSTSSQYPSHLNSELDLELGLELEHLLTGVIAWLRLSESPLSGRTVGKGSKIPSGLPESRAEN